ncbi:MAG: hypothetical protein IJW18_09715 [Lachnospiraceae bacterium]|nr:hypothetical protein [Lachnospiraceae bacterium]
MGEVTTKSKGSFIYLNNQPVTEVALLLSGKVNVIKGNNSFSIGQGELIGLFDLMNENYEYSYVAAEDITMFPIEVSATPETFLEAIDSNKEYRGSIIIAIAKYFSYLYMQNKKLYDFATNITTFITEKQSLLFKICKNNLLPTAEISELPIDSLTLPASDISPEIVAYYNNLSKISKASADSFYGENSYIPTYHFSEAFTLSKNIYETIKSTNHIIEIMRNLILSTEGSTLFTLFINIYNALGSHKDSAIILDGAKSLFSYAKTIGTSSDLIADAQVIIEKLTGGEVADITAPSDEEKLKAFLAFKETATNTLDKLIGYSDIPEEYIKPFRDAVIAFRGLKNKNASTDNVVLIRKTIAKYFYQLYEAIFFKYVNTGAKNPLIDLFLNTCFVDESLVTEDQLRELFELDFGSPDNDFHVYTLYEWLVEIYRGNQEPSRNEFDMDYAAMLRERKRTEKLSDKEIATLAADKVAKTKYEIQNFFRSTHRITCGQIVGFCPILYSEYSDDHFSSLLLSKNRISKLFEQYSNLDFSCLYRVVPYEINRYGLGKEYVQCRVTPNIILNPIVGQKGILWQEIAGAKRDTAARFAFPLFFRGDINSTILYTLGCYRWELCKTIEGIHWNDLQQPSLTSEFYDYISFYKKNSNLSPEAKEKIKNMLTKCHNNMRDVFATEYVTYMLYESTGASRLNRICRNILFKYCPFNAETRKVLTSNPNYRDMIDLYVKNCSGKLRRINSVMNLILNGGGRIPPEFEVNRDFYSL